MPSDTAASDTGVDGEQTAEHRRSARIRRLFGAGTFGRSVAILAGGTAVGQALLVASSPILTRLFSPDEFGLFGVYTAFIVVSSSVLSLRYEAAIVTAKSVEEARQLAGLALRLVIPTSVLASVALTQFITFSLFGFDGIPLYAALLGFAAMVAAGSTFVARYWLLREERFGVMAQIAVTQSGGRALSQITFGLLGLGWVGLAGGDLLGRLLALLRAAKGVSGDIRRDAVFDRDGARALSRKYRDFATYLTPSTLINSLAGLLAVPLVALFYGPGAAGQFFLVTRVLALPSALVGGAVADSFHSRIARGVRSGEAKVRSILQRTAAALLAVGLVPAVTLVLAGEALFTFVFGSSWAEAGLLAAALAPKFLAGFVVSPVSRIVLVVGGQRTKLVYDVLALAGVVAALAYADSAGFDLVDAGLLLSVVGVLAYAVYYWILLRIASKDRSTMERDG